MINVCGVRLTPNGKVYLFNPRNVGAEKGDLVVVESAHGNIIGEIVYASKEIEKMPEGNELKPVIRIATDQDLRTAAENEELAKKAFDICKHLISQQGLNMKLFRTEYTLDRSKAIFYYVSEQRVDFRNLVKELAPRIKIRIEMVQVGPREHAKAIGGIGLCGRQFCCQGFMTTFEPVTIKMAKDQGLTSNPTKYSGSCGKLLCCIRHEEAAYEYAHGIMPKNGSLIMTEDGPGKIIVVNMLKETCTVKVGLESNFEIKSYGVESIRQLTETEKAEYIALRKKEKDEMEAEAQKRLSSRNDEEKASAEGSEDGTKKASKDRSADDGENRGERPSRQQRRRDNRRDKRNLSAEQTEGEAMPETASEDDPSGNYPRPGKERGKFPKFRKGKKLGNPEERKPGPKPEFARTPGQGGPGAEGAQGGNRQGRRPRPGFKGPRNRKPQKPDQE
ncbi:MAG: hypothetical protein K6B54_03515 [Clostridia bacterium]|nr:hypothetical protein [Clostridia bacterium]